MMADSAWIGIDLGTQSVRAIAADDAGSVLATSSQPLSGKRSGREHTQIPADWWRLVCACCQEIMSIIPTKSVRAIAVDATSGTILLTDRELRPVSEALMYDDGRAEAEAKKVQEVGEPIWTKLGYRMQPSWALPKLLWLWRRTECDKNSMFLTHQNDFINGQLAGSRLATDSSHSLKTGYDLLQSHWPLEVFSKLDLPEHLFPAVVAPGSVLGSVSAAAAVETGLPAGLPIISGMTDGCAAQIAAGAVQEGSWNSVLGTTLVLKGATTLLLRDPLGAVYSHLAPDGKWLPGGASSTGAGIITMLFGRENLKNLETQATKEGPTDLVIYPLHALGERFPFTAPAAEYFQLGTPRDSVELYRAILQGVAFLERLCFDYVRMLGAPLFGAFSISGGAVRNQLWNKIRASVLGRTLTVPVVTEAAFGMAVFASSATSSLEEAASRMVLPGSTVNPTTSFSGTYGEPYRKLLRELEQRGWLPADLAAYSMDRISV
jgi:sugar (pentulose or hexulose) kinase